MVQFCYTFLQCIDPSSSWGFQFSPACWAATLFVTKTKTSERVLFVVWLHGISADEVKELFMQRLCCSDDRWLVVVCLDLPKGSCSMLQK